MSSTAIPSASATHGPADRVAASRARGGRRPARNHPVVRITHWIAAVAIVVMVGSGLQIFNAYPSFHRKGEGPFPLWPFEGHPAPHWATFGGWLAGGRMWHFAMMWVLVANALVYLGFVYLHGEWRDLVPRRGDPRDAWQMAKFYLYLRPDHPLQGKHNVMQKLTYFSLPIFAALIVLSGLAIWKPVSLGWITALWGGYVWARWWHFVFTMVVVALAAAHVFMVFAVDPYSIRAMTTGGYDPALSPEERNARPFYHLLPRYRDWRARGRVHDAAGHVVPDAPVDVVGHAGAGPAGAGPVG